MSASDIFVIIRYQARPGREEAALGELSDLVTVVRRVESDCKGITIVRDTADPDAIMLIEIWSSREAYTGPHFRTPHLLAFKERAGEFFTGPPEITFWHPVTQV